MPCAPEFSYLESASAEAGSTSTDPATAPDALPSLASRHEGFFVALAPAEHRRTTPRTNPQLREENADDRAGHRGPPSAAAGPYRRTRSPPPSSTSRARSPSSALSRRSGADTVFGIPGGAILPAYDPMMDSTRVRHVLVRHEQGAGHAATGYAQATGKVGVCMATSGPGATNLVTPIADAHMDSVPLVAITGQVASKAIGTDAFQEADICGITMPITKHNFLVTKAEDIPRTIAEAFHIASTGRPGPVLVDIAKDALQAQTTFSWPPQHGPARLPPGDQAARQADPRGRQADHPGQAPGAVRRRRRHQGRRHRRAEGPRRADRSARSPPP